jgi:uncharacterized phage protein (TIGR01671 family)
MNYRFFDQIEYSWVSEEWIEENTKEVLDWILYDKSIPKEIIINRCTGLEDKNGKLIYEGDILRVFADPEDYGGYTGHDYIESVEWWEDTCGFGLSEGHGLDEGWNLEIIGNIYEHNK